MLKRLAVRSMMVTALGGILGLVTLMRDIYVARLFGFSPEIKDYIAAALLPTILINSAGGAMTSSYTPFFYERNIRSIVTTRWWKNRTLIDSGALVFAAYLLIAMIRHLLGNLFPEPSRPFTQSFALDSLALGVIIVVALYSRTVNAVLLSRERYVASTLCQCALPLGFIVFLLVMPASTAYTRLIEALAVGYALQALICSVLDRQHSDEPLSDSHTTEDVSARVPLVKRFTAMFVGALILALLEYVEVTFAAQRSAQSVATVNYASRIITLLLGFVMAGTGNILTLSFVDLGGDKRDGKQRMVLVRLLGLSVAIGAVCCATAWLLSPWAVQLAYGGGRMTLAECDILAQMIARYSCAIPFALAGFAAGRVLVAYSRQSSLLYGALATVMTSIVFNLVFLYLDFPFPAVIYASVAGYMVSGLLLVILAFHELRYEN